MSPAALLLWLGLAALAQVCVALFGVLSRALQTQAEPPIPALRLLLIFNLLGLGCLALLDLLGLGLAASKRLWQRRRRQQAKAGHAAAGHKGADVDAQTAAEAGDELGAAKLDDGSEGSSTTKMQDGSSSDAGGASKAQREGRRQSGQQHGGEGEDGGEDPAAVPGAPLVAKWRLAQPELPLERGLSRKLAGFEARHPRAHRWLAATITAASIAVACGAQLVAPGFVDAAIVQLVNTFGVLVVVFFQAALLGHRLPLLVWPCSAGTVAGAAMVIVPSIGEGTSGGLDSPRAWLGFGLSVLFMLSASAMYICLQAFRRLRFKGSTLLYFYMSLIVVVALPLSLALDGTDWAAGFAGWTAGNWCMLLLGGSMLYVGQMYLLQYTAWQLGAPLVSMMYGLRLVASILLSMGVLSTTVIQTGVQIAGAAVTVLSVTIFAAHRWLVSRQAAKATMGTAASNHSGPPGSGQVPHDGQPKADS